MEKFSETYLYKKVKFYICYLAIYQKRDEKLQNLPRDKKQQLLQHPDLNRRSIYSYEKSSLKRREKISDIQTSIPQSSFQTVLDVVLQSFAK